MTDQHTDSATAPARRPARIRQALLVQCVALALATAGVHAQPVQELAEMSLEQLSDIVITSVSKAPEPLSGAAASVYVITAEDIHRSGARTLPEALRLAPNLHVAQLSGIGYAISARGMNGSNSSAPNKLLVLVDGRSVYTPLFSGVFWDVQDTLLENIERIEVISGPGGTLWGTNAVNGVINVVTRDAAATQGVLVSAAAGDRASDIGVRHGGELGASGHYRVFARYMDRDRGKTLDGSRIDDAGQFSRVGLRADWTFGEQRLDLSASAYEGSSGQPEPGLIATTAADPVLGDVETSGFHVVAHWQRELAGGGNLALQAYYDHTEREVPPYFSQDLDIVDLHFLHALPARGRHALTWGANLRHSDDSVVNSPLIAFLPAELQQDWKSLFAQDEVRLRNDLRLVLGARLEENDYTGTEFLPSARMAWQVAPNHLWWSAVSRAVRAPSRLDVDTFLPGEPPFLLAGGPPVRSEVAVVYELGYRGRPGERFQYSATLFHNDYDHLRTQEVDPGGTFIQFASLMEGKATGIEMWGAWQATPQWRLTGGLTLLDEDLRLKPGSNDLPAPLQTGFNPSHTWQLRSAWNVGADTTVDLGLRHVAALDREAVPAYTTLDARLGWRLRPGLELAVTGSNLLGSHAEYGAVATRMEHQRAVFFSLNWQP